VNLGYCGLDRERSPLRGDEIRPCWEAVPEAPAAEPASLADLVVLPIEPTALRYGLFADSER
jgi:hypothetical protein